MVEIFVFEDEGICKSWLERLCHVEHASVHKTIEKTTLNSRFLLCIISRFVIISVVEVSAENERRKLTIFISFI